MRSLRAPAKQSFVGGRWPVKIWPAGSALPVADAAEPAVVQRSTAEEGAPPPTKMSGTANRRAAPRKSLEPQGFSLKGTKIDQWVKVGTGQEKIRSSKRWSDFSLYTDENSSEVTTISELFGFYEFIFGVIPMLSSSSASSSRLWTFSFLYAIRR